MTDRLPLQVRYQSGYHSKFIKAYWKESAPFILNDKAVLIHRPKTVTTHKLGEHEPHLAVWCYCNNGFTGTKKFTFVSEPPIDGIVCRRCEEAAIAAGLPSSAELAGRHVHIGGIVAVADCCKEIQQ